MPKSRAGAGENQVVNAECELAALSVRKLEPTLGGELAERTRCTVQRMNTEITLDKSSLLTRTLHFLAIYLNYSICKVRNLRDKCTGTY